MFAASIYLFAAWLSPQVMRWVVWTGLVVLTGALVVLARTTWGQAQPLRKCIVLSLIAHTLLGIYASTVTIVTASINGEPGQEVTVMLGDENGALDGDIGAGADSSAWEQFADHSTQPGEATLDEEEQPDHEIETPGPVETSDVAASPVRRADLPADDDPLERPERNIPALDVPPPATSVGESGIETSNEADIASGDGQRLDTDPGSSGQLTTVPKNDSNSSGQFGAAGVAHGWTIPGIYQGRIGKGRIDGGLSRGATRETEAAVQAALRWLAVNQSKDGRWDPRHLEAGREVMINGHDRSGAGSHADTGITGLVLLAFLAAGNTHTQGEHAEVVLQGLEFLLQSQSDQGHFYGQATMYEQMYCHAMAALAVSEAYAMTGDERLKQSVERAVAYSVKSQDRTSGGWRYTAGDPGDTSQLGWQVMLLKSAEATGVPIPADTRDGMVRFLGSVSSGKHRGHASYRPGHRVSRAMTAEAIYCRQLLGMSRSNPSSDEAGDFILEELPGQGESNLYYWYYATLATYQLQGDHWKIWDAALKKTLLRTQRADGDLAGSWDPDPVWGAYGGRAYGTAMSALCLEVYYRYLPLYVETAKRAGETK